MRREVTLEEISDGRLYDANDMVKADCQDPKQAVSPLTAQMWQTSSQQYRTYTTSIRPQ